MNRRNFLKYSGIFAAMSSLPASFHLSARNNNYSGKLLISIQVRGAWDVTSLCDPKMNVPGEAKINHWADTQETQTAGNIQYAPFANNQSFFEKHYKDMLVINGIDHQTNSHSAGETQSYSGRISEGYPTLTALFSACTEPDFALSHINNGGFVSNAGLIRSSSFQDSHNFSTIIEPNTPLFWNHSLLHSEDYDLMKQARLERLEKMKASTVTTPRQKNNRQNYLAAINNSSSLDALKEELANAGEIADATSQGIAWSNLAAQGQMALLAMKAGVSVAADLNLGGFDTHQNHDNNQADAMGLLTKDIEKIWEYAELYGLADRLMVVVQSDFSRTPMYNEYGGKDHWPIGSSIIMEKNAPWANRMVGFTDEGHNTFNIDPSTLQKTDTGGTHIYPKHVVHALRKYLGIDQHTLAAKFPFTDIEDFDFFNANL